MIDVSAENGWLSTTLRIMTVMQMVIQARWINESSLLGMISNKMSIVTIFVKMLEFLFPNHKIAKIWEKKLLMKKKSVVIKNI